VMGHWCQPSVLHAPKIINSDFVWPYSVVMGKALLKYSIVLLKCLPHSSAFITFLIPF